MIVQQCACRVFMCLIGTLRSLKRLTVNRELESLMGRDGFDEGGRKMSSGNVEYGAERIFIHWELAFLMIQLVFVNFVVDAARREAEQFGGLRLIAARQIERRFEQELLAIFQRL
jgi:hypothetical protein